MKRRTFRIYVAQTQAQPQARAHPPPVTVGWFIQWCLSVEPMNEFKFCSLINRCGWCLPVICLLFVHQLFYSPSDKFDGTKRTTKPKMNHYPIHWKLFSLIPCNGMTRTVVSHTLSMKYIHTNVSMVHRRLSYYDRFANTVDDKN